MINEEHGTGVASKGIRVMLHLARPSHKTKNSCARGKCWV